MSAGDLLQAAIVARLRGDAALGELAVFDAAPVRASFPWALVDAPLLADASAVGVAGRTAKFAVSVRDKGERPVRLRALVGAIEAAVETLPRELGEGWRWTVLSLARGRITQSAPADWIATSEFVAVLHRLQ